VIFKFRGGEEGTDNLEKDILDINSANHSVCFEDKTYVFSEALDSESTQYATYLKSSKEVIGKVLEGYNGTIFVYGNSGSGKTYTMLGPDSVVNYLSSPDMKNQTIDPSMAESFGIILRACTEIFELMNRNFSKGEYVGYGMTAQYFEIYMEKIFDLINYTGEGASLKTAKTGETYIDPITKVEVRTPQDVCKILEVGQKHKKMSSTHINDRSSRSHTIFLLEIYAERKDGVIKKAKLNLIDLAGSEKYTNIGPSEERQKESKNINLSLLQLSNCIKALSEGHKFVSFRGSKLTHYLKDTLSGNSNTVLICTGSHQKINHSHTKSTLEFAVRAQKVKTKPVASEEMSNAKMIKLIKILKIQNEELRSVIENVRKAGDLSILDSYEPDQDKVAPKEEESEEETDEIEESPSDTTTYFDYNQEESMISTPIKVGTSHTSHVSPSQIQTENTDHSVPNQKYQDILERKKHLEDKNSILNGKKY
jgi:kinesin family protein 5